MTQRVLTSRMIFDLVMDRLEQGGEPVVSYWGRNGAPVGHRADCKPRDIGNGRCTCALIRINAEQGRDAAYEMWAGPAPKVQP